nr:bifunctional precorrin-2 dehydrogenase/sirohydrochlorin ferrochelatase [Aneurinibacillus sp. XH2]
MRSYPMFADLRGKLCVVVGGGRVAERKVASLLASGARVRVISPSCTERLRELGTHGEIELAARSFEPADINDALLVLAATDDAATNLLVSRSAGPHQWVNVADRPDLCSFTVPAVVERGALRIAVGTEGRCPGFARKMKEWLQGIIGPEYGEHLNFVAAWRTRARTLMLSPDSRRELMDRLLDDALLELTRRGDRAARDREAERFAAGLLGRKEG